ncbi:MAG: HNH endonuclease [Sedimentisphaerales bacterium]|nr:HNH endonuclease [Sedimentisphaerales bacterium]
MKAKQMTRITIPIPPRIERIAVATMLLYRRIRFGCAFRKIPLTKGKYAIVDPEDYDALMRYKWHTTKNGLTFYAKRNPRLGKKRKAPPIYMHRYILKPPPLLVVDHINFDGLDNRKANLRLATRKQNNRHTRRTRKTGSSKYKGVTWYTREKRWVAKITADGITRTLGYFKSERTAALAYDRAAKIYHKEFAALNFPKLH